MKKIYLSIFFNLFLFANSLTIYSSNMGYYYEHIKISLSQGYQEIKFTNIPQSIIVDSIAPNFEDGVQLISQSFKNNPLSLENLLKANLNQEVEFYSLDQEKKLLKGRLIHLNPTIIESNSKYYIVSSSSIIFNKLPKNVDTKPYILWSIHSKISKESSVDLSYLFNGIGWSSNYTARLDRKYLHLKAWATIINKSGKDFNKTDVELIAGVVNRDSLQRASVRRLYKRKVMEASANINVAPKSISGYHLYKLPYRVTIHNNESKQYVMFEAKNIKYNRYAVTSNNYFRNYGERKLHFRQVIEFKNSQKNGLGLPLPEGIVRVYKDKHYLGEAHIANTPKDEKIMLNIGEFFDIVGKQKIIKYIVRDKYRDIETKYTLHNRGEEPIVVKLSENIPRYKDKAVFKTSCSGICSSKKINAFSREFTIKLKANESYSFTTEFEVYQ